MAKKKKWKKRIKKALKGAALAGGALLALKALKKPTMALGTRAPDFVKGIPPYKHKDDTMYFPNKGIAAGVDYHAGPYERSKIASKYGIDTNTIAGSPVDRSGPSRWDTWGSGDQWAAKKGGRAGHRSGGRVKGCGIAKRGLGRALKGGK